MRIKREIPRPMNPASDAGAQQIEERRGGRAGASKVLKDAIPSPTINTSAEKAMEQFRRHRQGPQTNQPDSYQARRAGPVVSAKKSPVDPIWRTRLGHGDHPVDKD